MNPPQLPKVSVIVTAYNAEKFVLDCIESAVIQDYPNKDLWIYDDCSTDQTQQLIIDLPEQYMQPPFIERADEIENAVAFVYKGVYVVYIRGKNNSGPSKGRNIAIASSMRNGSHLFQILDSDDQMYPNKITELIKPIMRDPETVAITYGDYIIIGMDGVCRYEAKPSYDYMRYFGGDCHIHSGCLFSGLALKERYPYFYPEDQRVCEDYFLGRSLLRNRWMAYNVGIPLTLVRSHSNDSTSSVSNEIWQRDYQKTMMNS